MLRLEESWAQGLTRDCGVDRADLPRLGHHIAIISARTSEGHEHDVPVRLGVDDMLEEPVVVDFELGQALVALLLCDVFAELPILSQ